MLAQVDSADLTEMEADHLIEPWGEFRGDLQAAIIAAEVRNIRTLWSGGQLKQPRDFMPDFGGKKAPRKVMSAEEIQESLRRWRIVWGGRGDLNRVNLDRQAGGNPPAR